MDMSTRKGKWMLACHMVAGIFVAFGEMAYLESPPMPAGAGRPRRWLPMLRGVDSTGPVAITKRDGL